MNYWEQFKGEKWKEEINVSDFLINNYTEYTGNEEFLEGVTDKTKNILNITNDLLKKEHENGGVLDVDVDTVTSLLTFKAGYVDKENEVIFGLQTDKPFHMY